jgi:LysM repeat protein/ABC-type branched-subunit amino acid transport system substrate-binding protein
MSRKRAGTRIISTISTLFLLIFFIFSLSAQEKPGGEKVIIGGKTYTLYMAVSGDSPFSIARKFGITLDELNSANPEIKEKLNSGQTIKIPVMATETRPQQANGLQNDENDDHLFTFHSVRRKETVFSIAQKSNVTLEDIYRFNPQSREGIKEGDVLKIPKQPTQGKETKKNPIEIQRPIKHVVKRKETLFSIARQYNISEQEILKSNPTIKGTLSKGTVLIIPEASALPVVRNKPKEEPKFSEYRIVGGDNFYQLEKRFGISKDELEKLNPALKEGFKIGMVIKTPMKDAAIEDVNKTANTQSDDKIKQAVNEPSALKTVPSFKNQSKTFQIGIFLPFCQNLNDSSQIVQRTASYIEFYSGILLAAEKLTEAGMKLKLFTYDTFHDNKVVEKLVKRPEFLSLDLVIGPVYPENQKIVAELCAKNHIPMISPLSSDSRFVSTTPGYYQINPSKKLRLSCTAEYIAKQFANQNIIVLNHGTISGDLKLILDRLNQKSGTVKIRQYNILAEGTSGLEEMLKADKENVIVLADEDEANVSVAITRLNTISKSNKIMVIGLQEYTRMQSIDIEYLHNLKLHYLAPYFIDYGNAAVNTFIEKYRSAYNCEPTQYSFQGYDIALHFIASLGKSGRNFPAANPIPGIDLLQAGYNFQKLSDLGGYMNQTLYIIEYTDNYEVRPAGKIQGTIVTDNGERHE